jgi:hypothetical protein
MHPINFVFDIDDTLVLHFEKSEWKREPQEIVEVYGEDFLQKHTVWAIDYPHFIFPGIPTLWRWLYGMGHRLAMFSSAVSKRNEELADNLTSIVFGDQAPQVRPTIKVFSRNDLFDTYHTKDQNAYQPIFFGNYKKVLSGVVVPQEEMSWSFLIDDDRSYMALHEEFNLIKVETYNKLVPLSPFSFQAHAYLYKAFYLAGLFKAIFDKIEKDHVTAVEAAKVVQIDSVEEEFDRRFYYPTIKNVDFYEEGERILSTIDSEATIPPSIMIRMKNKDYDYR